MYREGYDMDPLVVEYGIKHGIVMEEVDKDWQDSVYDFILKKYDDDWRNW